MCIHIRGGLNGSFLSAIGYRSLFSCSVSSHWIYSHIIARTDTRTSPDEILNALMSNGRVKEGLVCADPHWRPGLLSFSF